MAAARVLVGVRWSLQNDLDRAMRVVDDGGTLVMSQVGLSEALFHLAIEIVSRLNVEVHVLVLADLDEDAQHLVRS